jgi:hypothetical protein
MALESPRESLIQAQCSRILGRGRLTQHFAMARAYRLVAALAREMGKRHS